MEVPKYLKATKIDLERNTFKNVAATRQLISEKEMNEFFNNENLHNNKCAQLVELKRQLDAQLEV